MTFTVQAGRGTVGLLPDFQSARRAGTGQITVNVHSIACGIGLGIQQLLRISKEDPPIQECERSHLAIGGTGFPMDGATVSGLTPFGPGDPSSNSAKVLTPNQNGS